MSSFFQMDFNRMATLLCATYALFCSCIALADTEKPVHVPIAKPTNMIAKGVTSNLYNEVCAQVCGFWSCTAYCCQNGVCCTPGNPQSLCCPETHPLCVVGVCCPEGYPEVCGETCCTPDGVCCNDDNFCCHKDETCCGDKCCEEGYVCCKEDDQGESACCRNTDSCCGNECCGDENGCCINRETETAESTCCNNNNMAFCDDCGCNTPCESQFDAIPCKSETNNPQIATTNSNAQTFQCPKFKETKKLYRILRPNESCDRGLVARDPDNRNRKSVLSHVNCGSRVFTSTKEKYKHRLGQFCVNTTWISTTTAFWSPYMSNYLNKTKADRHQRPLVSITYPDDFPPGCAVSVDLTEEDIRDATLNNSVLAKKWARSACEVLVRCKLGHRLKCQNMPLTDTSDYDVYGRLNDEL